MRIVLALLLFMVGCSPPKITTVTDGRASPVHEDSTGTEATASLSKVTIGSADGLQLVGSLYSAPKANSPALLLLHQWQSDRHSYDEFAKELQSRGVTVLSIDGRGFGESTKKADGSVVTAGRNDADVKAMLGDVDAAFKFLSTRENVNSKRVGIVGASYGSSLALIYAADHPDVQAVALLSPGLNYFGNMPTEPPVAKIKERRNQRSLLFIAAEDDKESVDAVKKLDPIDVDNYFFPRQIFKSGGHGTALLKVGATESISDFFADVFDLPNLHVRT